MLARVDRRETDCRAAPRAAAGTERLCVVTRAVRPVERADPLRGRAGRRVVPDLKRKLPGRGALGHGATARRWRRGRANRALSRAASSAR